MNSRIWINTLFISVLAAVTLIIFYQIIGHAFLYRVDDSWMVINKMTESGFTQPNIQHIFTTVYYGQYSPINQLYYVLLFQIGRYDASWFHGGSLLFHILNVIIVYRLIFLLLARSTNSHKAAFIAFFTALIFAVHPAQVESVAWISASKIVLGGFFYLTALLLYVQYTNPETKGRITYLILSCLCTILAMGCKEQFVTLPGVLLLIDWLVLKRKMTNWKIYIDKIPYVVIALGMTWITLQINNRSLSDTVNYSWVNRLVLGCYSLVYYIRTSILPWDLTYFHGQLFKSEESPSIWLWLYVLVIPILAGIIYKLRKKPIALFCIFFFVYHLLLVLHIIPLPRMITIADRYIYLSLIGSGILISLGGVKLYEHIKANWKKALLFFILFIYLSGLSFCTYRYTQTWRNTEAFKQNRLNFDLLLQHKSEQGKPE